MKRIASGTLYVAFLWLVAELTLQGYYYFTSGGFLFARVGVPIWAPNEHSGIFNRADMAFEHHTNEHHSWYYTNHQGFRTDSKRRPYSPDKPDDVYRIMLLGPSFAFGWGVDYEQTFGRLLEAKLSGADFADGRRVELINAGVNSMPPSPHLSWYREVGRSFEPNLVVQLIYGTMAVTNEPKSAATVDDEGYLIPGKYTTGRRIRAQLKKLGTVFYPWILYTRLTAPQGAASTVEGAGREMSTAGTFDPDGGDVRTAMIFYERLAREVREGGGDLQIVFLPLSYAVHPEDVSRWRHHGVHDAQAQAAFDAAFCRYLDDRGIPCFDVTDELRRAAASDDERLYFWLDIHWTAEGNDVSANAVARNLLRLRTARQ